MSLRYTSHVLFFLGALGAVACSGDDSAALPLPDAGPTPTADGAAHEGGSVDAAVAGDGGEPDGAASAADASVGTDAAAATDAGAD